MSASNFKSLQRVQNTLARVVLRRGKFEHITPALIDLHWLPVQYRVTYKLATLTYSIKQSGQPSYLHQLLQDYQPTYSLRSASHDLLATTRPRSVASRAFRHSAATTGNSIPFNIRNVTLSLLSNVDWRHSSLTKPLPSSNRIPAPTNSSRYIWCVTSFILLTYLLTLYIGIHIWCWNLLSRLLEDLDRVWLPESAFLFSVIPTRLAIQQNTTCFWSS